MREEKNPTTDREGNGDFYSTAVNDHVALSIRTDDGHVIVEQCYDHGLVRVVSHVRQE
jgi:metal-dependent hydrolase (beta-lactamase superfamily II)